MLNQSLKLSLDNAQVMLSKEENDHYEVRVVAHNHKVSVTTYSSFSEAIQVILDYDQLQQILIFLNEKEGPFNSHNFTTEIV